jgi:two-component system response regulator DesR
MAATWVRWRGSRPRASCVLLAVLGAVTLSLAIGFGPEMSALFPLLSIACGVVLPWVVPFPGGHGPPLSLLAVFAVALLDIELPGRSGLDVAADLRARLPGCMVLMLTTFGRPGYLRRAIEAGARGFLLKDAPVEELAGAVRKILAGQQVVDPGLAAAALAAGPNPLTDRERDVLRAADGGATVADIAARLFLSESTVRNYLSSAIGKTHAPNRIEAAETARRNGWL